MYEHDLPDDFPDWLRKDVVATRHEVPATRGRSHTVYENFYTPKVFRWAMSRWLSSVPENADPRALCRALPIVLADPKSFYAYLTIPDAFEELYQQELSKVAAERYELDRVKRLWSGRRYHWRGWTLQHLVTGLVLAYAIFATVLML